LGAGASCASAASASPHSGPEGAKPPQVLMNGLYGGFGAARGGIFPNGAAIAAAITATGRGWLCRVKGIVESVAWLGPDGTWGIGAEQPEGAKGVRVIYGDTGASRQHRLLPWN
jgi:hypothetical protein